MSGDDLITAAMRERRSRPLEPGWTAWVPRALLATRRDQKPIRPWCRGRVHALNQVVWFARTAQAPLDGDRRAVCTDAGCLPGLNKKGWFYVDDYVPTPTAFAPPVPPAVVCGLLDRAIVESLHRKLYDWMYRERK